MGKDYQVVTVSFNFRDTPEKAKKKKETFTKRYSKEMAENWKFLTTDSATIFKMIGSVGFHIKAVGLDFVHPSAIVIVSPERKDNALPLWNFILTLRFENGFDGSKQRTGKANHSAVTAVLFQL